MFAEIVRQSLYPLCFATSSAFSRLISAYSWVTSALAWPRMSWAASRPYSLRMRVAALWRSWCGCQTGMAGSPCLVRSALTASQARAIARR